MSLTEPILRISGFRGKAITVASHYLIDSDTSHIDQTIIDGSNPSHPDSASVVYFVNGEDTTSVLCGFTIKGGTGTTFTFPSGYQFQLGGGIYCDSAFGATLINNRITENKVSGNSAGGAGVFFYRGSRFIILERNRIYGNRVTANPNDGFGSGVYVVGDDVNVHIAGNVFEQDTIVAGGYAIGGAVYIAGDDNLLASGVIKDNLFRGNIAEAGSGNGVGGGIYFFATEAIEVSENVFEGNIAKSNYAFAEGGALLFEDWNVPVYGRKMITGNTLVNNMTITQSGTYGSGGAIELFYTMATVSGNYIAHNSAQGGTARGGAIQIEKSAFLLENNIINDNSATYGGAMHVESTPQSGTGMDIINNTIVNNNATSTGGGIRVFEVPVNIINSILWGNSPNQIATSGGGSVNVRYSNVQGGWAGLGNIDANPHFISGDTLFNLLDSSQCIGAGIDSIQIGGTWYYAPSFDFDSDPRPDPVDDYVDIGAQESPYAKVVSSIDRIEESIPNVFKLDQNYPNPFNPTTTIEFSLPQSSFVTLKVYNILGEEVATLVDEKLPAGTFKETFDASDLPNEIYFYALKTGEYKTTRKMILLK